MTELFLQAVNRSICAVWVVLAVTAARFLLKKAPKWINVILWGLVALRLVCPVSLESALSLIPSAKTVSPEILLSPAPEITSGIDSVNRVVNPILAEQFAPEPVASANPLQILIPILALVWCAGMAVMTLYTVFSYWQLRRQVRTAVRVGDGIYLSEFVSTPFVLGLFRPRIYLPYSLPEADRDYVIAHERTHIRRRDHWWKPLGFLLLTIHWFNPFLWLAYILLCRDIELACDEKVVQSMDPGQRVSYSQALLNCSVSRRSIAACPLAFGEVGVKERIKNVLNYRKPAFWMVLAAVLVCLVTAVCFLTDPKTPEALKWLQTLAPSKVLRIEYRCPGAEPGKQYALYEGADLSGAVDVLKGFEGTRIPENALEPTSGSRYTLTVTTTDLRIHTVENIADVYLCIDGDFFEDTHRLLAPGWDAFFRGTGYLPTAAESGLGVEMTVEECSPTGATVVFRQYGTEEGSSLFGGNDYFLQRFTDEGWEDLPTLESPTFTSGSYSFASIRRQSIQWQWLYGTLPEGHYRIGKSVSPFQNGGQACTVYGEFTLDSSVPGKEPPTGFLELTDFPQDDGVWVGIVPTELGQSRYALCPDQESAIDAFEEALAGASSGTGWRDDDRPTGITIRYQGEYLFPLESGDMVSFSGRISAADAAEIYAISTEIARQAGHQSAVWPERIRRVRSATLDWYDTVTITDPQKLSRLETMLSGSTVLFGGAGCPFGNPLTLELENGETLTLSIAADRCAAWLSNGVYFDFGSGNETLYRLFSSPLIYTAAREGGENLPDILTYLDWSDYANTFGPEETMTLITLLRDWALEDPGPDRISTILNIIAGLDGAYTEAFAGVLRALYEANPEDVSRACLANAAEAAEPLALRLLSEGLGLGLAETRNLLESHLP